MDLAGSERAKDTGAEGKRLQVGVCEEGGDGGMCREGGDGGVCREGGDGGMCMYKCTCMQMYM